MRLHLIISHILVVSAVTVAVLLAPEPSAQELPPEMQVDRLLIQAEREIEDGEHWSAVFTFEQILAVCEEQGLAIPAEFWFRQAGVLQGADLYERAVEASTRYLQETGREGEHYRAVLELLDAAEVDLAEARRAEALARAAAERAEREATARAEAISAGLGGPSAPASFQATHAEGAGRCRDHLGNSSIREVHVESFWISKHEVTFAQWDVCVEYGGCR